MTTRRTKGRTAAGILIAVLVSAVAAVTAAGQRASELIGYGAAAGGRGGVDLAIAGEASSLATNPAGLMGLRTARLDVLLRGFLPRVEVRNPLNPDGETSDEPALAPSVAFAFDPAPEAGGPGDFRLGIGLFHHAGNSVDMDLVTADFPGGTPFRSDYHYSGAGVGAAARVADWASVGVSLHATTAGLAFREAFEVDTGIFNGASPLGTSWGELLKSVLGIEEVRLDVDFDAAATPGFFFVLGAMFDVTENLRIGVAWRSPGWLPDFEGDVTVDVSRIFPEPDPIVFPDGFITRYDGRIRGFDFPQSAGAGLAWQATERLLLGLDLRWVQWSATHDALRVSLRDGDNAGFNAFVGSSGLDIETPLRWRDQVSAGLGAEYALLDSLVLRAGVTVSNDATRESTLQPLAAALATVHMALGAGWRGPGFRIDIAWIHSFDRSERIGASDVSSDLDGARVGAATDSFFVQVSIDF